MSFKLSTCELMYEFCGEILGIDTRMLIAIETAALQLIASRRSMDRVAVLYIIIPSRIPPRREEA